MCTMQVHLKMHSLSSTGLHEMGATREETIVAGTWAGKIALDSSCAERAHDFPSVSMQAGFKGDAGKSHVLGRSRFPAERFQAKPWLQVQLACPCHLVRFCK